MKKVSTIIMALAVIMGMTQCTKPAMPLYDGTYTGVTKEITFTTGGNSKVTADNSVLNELHFLWEKDDKLYVYGSENGTFSDGQYCGALDIVKGMDTENGFFSGTLDNVPTSGTLRFYYCAEGLFDELTRTIAVDLSSQDGSLGYIASHLVAYADVAVMESGDYSATLAVPYSVVKLDLHEFGTTDITMTGTTKQCVTISGNGECSFTAATDPETTISGAGANTYISVIPESGSTTLSFEGDNGIVGSRTINLESNTFQTLNNGGDPVPVLPVEGDDWINFNDEAMGITGMSIWSKFNLGVDKDKLINHPESTQPWEWYGDYYAWGETEPYVKVTFSDYHVVESMTWCEHPSHNLEIDFDNSVGYGWKNYLDGVQTDWNASYEWHPKPYNDDGTLDYAHDAAHVKWGGDWHLPTGGTSNYCDFKSLATNTYCRWTNSYLDIPNLKGWIFFRVKDIKDKGLWTGVNGKVIKNWTWQSCELTGSYDMSDPHMFLPATGRMFGASIEFGGEDIHDSSSFYWSRSLYYGATEGPNATSPSFDERDVYGFNGNGGTWRCVGMTIRPVR